MFLCSFFANTSNIMHYSKDIFIFLSMKYSSLFSQLSLYLKKRDNSLCSSNLQKNKSAFTLVELIVVITILSILSVIGFVVMSHQSSVARDGKRISDIKTLSESARITSAQLRLLPTPIADSIALSVSGTFIGYQGFMSTALVNPLGYGSDKIFDPKDNIPYTYRVNQYYDQAQFMAYLENPRFERSIEIAGIMNGGWFDGIISRAYALDISGTDLSKRYPYVAWDRLWIFLRKDNNNPMQSWVSGTGSQDISVLDNSTLRILVSEDTYLWIISTGALVSLKNGSFGSDVLMTMNSINGGSSNGSNGSAPWIPINIQAIAWSGEISLVWDDIPSATSYTIAWSTSISWSYTEISGIVNANYLHTWVTNDTNIFYKIRASNNYWTSLYSSILQTYAFIPCIDDLSNVDITQLNSLFSVSYNRETWCSQTNIDISNKSLTIFPNAITKLRELQYLTGGANSFVDLPISFGNLRKLKSVDLQRSWAPIAFNNLPDSFGNLQELEYLNLIGYPLNTLPESFSHLANLKDIRITDTRFIQFPEVITALQQLERLSIWWPYGGWYISSIPESIWNLHTLKYLEIVFWDFTTLPSTFGNLNNLEYLNLNWHHMSAAPSTQLLSLIKLNYLNLSWYLWQYPSQLFTSYTWSSPSAWNDYGANLRIRSLGDNTTTIQITRINP